MIQRFEFHPTPIEGLIEVTPFNADDVRGSFTKDYSKEVFEANGITHDLAEVFSAHLRHRDAFDLTRENRREVLSPAGCAHGYLVLEESVVSYKCAEKFYGEYDDGILWDDPDIAVAWPLERIGGREHVILAEKDKNLQSFAQFMDTYQGF